MRVISLRRLREFWERYPDAKKPLMSWYKVARKTNWDTFAQLRQTYPRADKVGRCYVFDIGGNKIRLVTTIHFNTSKIFIRNVLTHSEYDRNRWKEECLCQD